MEIREYVARALCRAAASSNDAAESCSFCDEFDRDGNPVRIGDCKMWSSFGREAEIALAATKDYSRLEPRSKPRQRPAFDICKDTPRS